MHPKKKKKTKSHYLCQHILVELGEVVGIKKVSHPAHPKQVATSNLLVVDARRNHGHWER